MAVCPTEALTDSLLRRLSDMKRVEEITKLQKLREENDILLRELEFSRQHLCLTSRLLRDISKQLKITIAALEAFDGKARNAENSWAQYWGIETQYEEAIFEMQSIH